jgi:hypothetical protein
VAVDRIQRDTADVSPHHFVDFLGCGMGVGADQRLIHRDPLRRNFKAILATAILKSL